MKQKKFSRIEQLRLKNGLSQVKASAILKMAKATYVKLERGEMDDFKSEMYTARFVDELRRAGLQFELDGSKVDPIPKGQPPDAAVNDSKDEERLTDLERRVKLLEIIVSKNN